MIPLPFQAYIYGYLWWYAVLGFPYIKHKEQE